MSGNSSDARRAGVDAEDHLRFKTDEVIELRFGKTMHPTGPGHFGVAERGIIALLNPERLRRILTKMLDEDEFLSPYGIRSLSNTGMFSANSNWRGPIWMQVDALIIRALLNFYLYYGDNFKIECPHWLRQADEPV